MTAGFNDGARWLLVGAAASLISGCAADGSGRVARSEADCPMNFTMTCEARRVGAETTYSHCRCVRHSDIGALPHR